MFLKISLAFFFLLIVAKRWQKYLIYTNVILSTISNTGYFFYVLFQCGSPTDPTTYMQKILDGKCMRPIAVDLVNYINGSINAGSDFMFATLPYFLLKESNMNRREKLFTGIILLLAEL